MKKVTFNINFHTVWGQKLCIVGSIPELGSWQAPLAKDMYHIGDGNWQLQLELPDSVTTIEYRYFLSVNDRQFFEEWERNHLVRFDGDSQQYTLYDYWQMRPSNLAFYSSAFTKSLFAHPCNTYERVIRSGKRLIIKVSAPRIEKTQNVAIAGNQPCLGNWMPEKALQMSCDSFPEWSIALDATEITFPLEFKFLVWDNEKRQPLAWETGENRSQQLLAPQEEETIIISGLTLHDDLPPWRCTGTVVPVFSLRSEKSFGVGDLGDLRMLVDWVKKTHQRVIQVLPMNDTTSTHTWRDSYPYSAISVYALHPMYIDLRRLGQLNDPERSRFYDEKQQELNAKESIDYEQMLHHKTAYCREYFEQEGNQELESTAFSEFYNNNKTWLNPYAAYCYLRDQYHTADFTQWGKYATYEKRQIDRLCRKDSKSWEEISFFFYLQYILHTQFKDVSDYARKNGVVLKGDLPIGVNRLSVDAWQEPQYFNMTGQAGAPPDDFSAIGQNWQFPTYNWEVMEKDNFTWWKNRFRKLSEYFDCFRIDHILGFFRIWEIPRDYVQGLCGHFNPALPLMREDIEHYGICFDEERFTTPHLHRRHLQTLFGDMADEVENSYLVQSASDYVRLKPFCDTQQKVEQLFHGKNDEQSLTIKAGLFRIANEVLFLRDPREPYKYHPRISGSHSFIYEDLDTSTKYAFDHLYWDFFYHRHNGFWKAQAYKRLTPLVGSTDMLVCGEDLGMIPQSVPEVMNRLQILSLEIERMPKATNREFTDMFNLPYLSVCTTSTHDMSPLRSWWKEDRGKTQRYYNQVLLRDGAAPDECSAELATQIIANHLATRSMLTIIPIQDWFAMDERLKNPDEAAERINIPADPMHYWRYRMHLSLESLWQADLLNEKIITLISGAGRK